MRISDWSSDVCSSDLALCQAFAWSNRYSDAPHSWPGAGCLRPGGRAISHYFNESDPGARHFALGVDPAAANTAVGSEYARKCEWFGLGGGTRLVAAAHGGGRRGPPARAERGSKMGRTAWGGRGCEDG